MTAQRTHSQWHSPCKNDLAVEAGFALVRRMRLQCLPGIPVFHAQGKQWSCPLPGCSWQSVFSSDEEDALCPIIRQPPPSGQRPPEGSRHDDDACPIIRQAALRQTPGGSRHWAESDSDVETLTPSRHSGVPLMQCPHRAQKDQFGRGDVESVWSWCHQYSRQSVS